MSFGFHADRPRLRAAGRIFIPGELNLSGSQVEQMRQELTLVNPAYKMAIHKQKSVLNIPEFLELLHEEEYGFTVPKHYLPRLQQILGGLEVDWVVPEAGDFKHTVHYTPLAAQTGVVETLDACVGDIIVRLPCGFGKSYLALYKAAQKPGRILIVVPTEVKRDEWIEEVGKVYGLEPKQIGIIQASKRRWEEFPVTITIMNTLSTQKFPPELLNGFATVIVDEAHLCTAYSISRALGRVNGDYISLSATPGTGVRRRILELNVGDTLVSGGHSQARKLTAYFVRINVLHYVSAKAWDLQKTLISRDTRHYLPIAAAFLKDGLEAGRNMMVLASQTSPLFVLHHSLNGRHKPGFVIGVQSLKDAYSADPQIRDLVDGVGDELPPPRRAHAHIKWAKKNANPILATGLSRRQPGGTGMDVAHLDGGLILYPVSDPDMVEQLKGRWDRPHPTKKDPVLFVMVPNTGLGIRAAESMKRKMQSLGCDVIEVEKIY